VWEDQHEEESEPTISSGIRGIRYIIRDIPKISQYPCASMETTETQNTVLLYVSWNVAVFGRSINSIISETVLSYSFCILNISVNLV
jgi:hypothetical protein